MMSRLSDSLEPRRLFSVDLTGSFNTTEATPYIQDTGPGYNISFKVKNIGSSNAALPIITEFFLSKDRKLVVGSDREVGGGTVTTLGAGKTSKITQQIDASGLAAGKYYLMAFVDSQMIYVGSQNPYADVNRDNNVIVSDAPVVQVVPSLDDPTFNGTPGKDVIKITQNETHIIVTDNGVLEARPLSDTAALNIQMGASPDKLTADATVTVPLNVSGGGGNDTIIGGQGNDELSGAGGKDKLYGQGGNDYLIGGGANDYLEGGAGDDMLSGGAGNDKLVGLAGKDYMIGGAGDDQLFGKDGEVDTLSGGIGTDLGDYDAGDVRASIEGVIV